MLKGDERTKFVTTVTLSTFNPGATDCATETISKKIRGELQT